MRKLIGLAALVAVVLTGFAGCAPAEDSGATPPPTDGTGPSNTGTKTETQSVD